MGIGLINPFYGLGVLNALNPANLYYSPKLFKTGFTKFGPMSYASSFLGEDNPFVGEPLIVQPPGTLDDNDDQNDNANSQFQQLAAAHLNARQKPIHKTQGTLVKVHQIPVVSSSKFLISMEFKKFTVD